MEAAEDLFLIRVGTKPKNHTTCGALQVAPQWQMVQSGTMRFGENHLPAAQRQRGRGAGQVDLRGEPRVLFCGLRQASSTAAQRRRVVAQDKTGIQEGRFSAKPMAPPRTN